VDKLPVNSNQVNYNDLQRYTHLRDLVLPLKNDREVSLLIGANVPDAFCAEQVRKGKAKQPAAVGVVVDWTSFEHMQ